jgi:hypothetical protein
VRQCEGCGSVRGDGEAGGGGNDACFLILHAMTSSGPQSRKGKLRGGHGRRGIAVGRALLRVNAGPGRVLGADCTMDVWDADDGRATMPLAGASESSHDRLSLCSTRLLSRRRKGRGCRGGGLSRASHTARLEAGTAIDCCSVTGRPITTITTLGPMIGLVFSLAAARPSLCRKRRRAASQTARCNRPLHHTPGAPPLAGHSSAHHKRSRVPPPPPRQPAAAAMRAATPLRDLERPPARSPPVPVGLNKASRLPPSAAPQQACELPRAVFRRFLSFTFFCFLSSALGLVPLITTLKRPPTNHFIIQPWPVHSPHRLIPALSCSANHCNRTAITTSAFYISPSFDHFNSQELDQTTIHCSSAPLKQQRLIIHHEKR